MIPFIIRILHPRLKADEYNRLLKNATFLSRIAYLCEDCYLYVTLSSTVSGKYNYEFDKNELIGTQPLKP